MCARTRSFSFLASLTVALVCAAGCDSKPVPQEPPQVKRHEDSATLGALEIKFTADGSGGMIGGKDKVTISFSGGEVVVNKQKILLRDKEVAQVPEDAKVVNVDYTAGMLTISADGKSLHEEKLGD